jgi:outer membrane protein assembly factor BamB
LWRFATGAEVFSSPTVADGVVYVGNLAGVLFAVDAGTGAERWRVALGGGVYASPAVAGGSVYVGSLDGALYAIGGES